MEKELLNKLKYLINKKKDFTVICEELQLEPYQVYGLAEMLKIDGFHIDISENAITKLTEPLPVNDVYEIPPLTDHSLMFLSDTHLGSKYDRLDILKRVYQEAAEREISTILHVGDISDGYYPNRQQQVYELRAIGADQQTDYIVNKYPQVDGIDTYFITGNHDVTHIRNDGFDIGRAIDRQRDDMHYLGPDVADVKAGKLKIRLFHGSKGPAYAKSYKLQKYAETIPQSEKPDILLQGHFHNSFYMRYQDMECFQVPALIDQTPYARSLGLANEKGIWIAKFSTDSKGNIIGITPELLNFNDKGVTKTLKPRRR